MLTVYVAASSEELSRAEHAMSLVRGHEAMQLTSRWVESIRIVGSSNPDAVKSSRAEWSRECLQDIDAADLVWLLVPSVGHGRGAYCELGYAFATGKQLLVSGDSTQSIFCSLGHEEVSDESAWDVLSAWAELKATEGESYAAK